VSGSSSGSLNLTFDSGNSLPDGTYTATLLVTTDDGQPAIEIPLTLTVENSGFTLWKETELASLPGGPYAQTGSGAEDDPDSDGAANLLEYALGLNPLAVDSSQALTFALEPVSTEVYPGLEVTRTANRSDLIYTVEISDDLIEWFSGLGYTVTLEDSATVLRVRSANSIDSAPIQFLRLKVERP
jgi:hypothetical protein